MSNKNQNLIVTINLIILLLPQVVMASAKRFHQQHKTVQEISKDINTPEKKAAAVAKLINIVKSEKVDVPLKEFAAKKLGQLHAVEAKELLKSLAVSLEQNDSTRQLKSITSLAYWQIRVTQEPTKELQNELRIKLLRGYEPPYADVVESWAIDELSNRGVKSALPDIIKTIKSHVSGKSADAQIKLCTTKIDLLTNNLTRHEALYKALVMEDNTDQGQQLKKWAIEELGKLDSAESRQILINFAKELENKYIDSSGERIRPKGDWLGREATYLYRSIIKILKCEGFSNDKIKAKGLKPDKVFLVDGYDEDCGCN